MPTVSAHVIWYCVAAMWAWHDIGLYLSVTWEQTSSQGIQSYTFCSP